MPLSNERFGRRDLRLASGLILFTYLTVHLANHALGLVSLEVAETGLRWTVAVWHSVPGTVVLYGAAAIHVSLALLAVYERCTLRMPPLQALRIVLGLWMPMVLITHFTGTRIAYERYGDAADYTRVVAALWTPQGGGRQLALLVPGWLHGCLGLKFAFGTRRGYRRALPALFGAALLLPVLSALGFLAMGRELIHVPVTAPQVLAVDTHQIALALVRDRLLAFYAAAIGGMLIARALRAAVERRRGLLITVTYPGRRVQVPRGWTILEASRRFGIAHRSLCGGNARCSTCRVRVTAGLEHCAAPTGDEQWLLARMRTGPDVRLACRLRPGADVSVVPLAAEPTPATVAMEPAAAALEHTVAVLIGSVRRSNQSASRHESAHDRAYALNLFHEMFGDAVSGAGGTPCGHAGAEAIGVFGVDGTLATGCRQALQALAAIGSGLAALNRRLDRDLGVQVEVVRVVHGGTVVVGPIGYRDAKTVTAIGPAVDTARRLLDWAKAHDQPCAVSRSVAECAAVAMPMASTLAEGVGDAGGALAVYAGALPLAGLAPSSAA